MVSILAHGFLDPGHVKDQYDERKFPPIKDGDTKFLGVITVLNKPKENKRQYSIPYTN